MTVEELIEKLKKQHPKIKLQVCHYAKRAGQAKPIIRPLAELRMLYGWLCLVEEDDRKLYLADR